MLWLTTDYLERMTALHRDFKAAIAGVPVAGLDWVPGDNMNSLSVLVVHAMGSQRYWVGDMALGKPSGWVRAEGFATHGLDEAALVKLMDETLAYTEAALAQIPYDALSQERPSVTHPGRTFRVGWSLWHALEHVAMHVGHAQVTRQLWEAR
jgi:uncharacterized damage-inducible protein DinB